MAVTRIEWADRTWNPITGCTKISEACQNCYAERMSKRLAGRCGYDKENPFKVTMHQGKFGEPLRWRKPSRIFVCSMGDLFHEDVPEQMIGQVWNHMRLAPWHIYMILTKRPERMKDFFIRITNTFPNEYPAPYIWLGVTAENQQRADERIPILLQTPAAKRFVSIEPTLGPVDLEKYILPICKLCNGDMSIPVHGGGKPCPRCINHQGKDPDYIDWVICGGETGPGARPMHPDWVRSLRDQCKSAEAPFFFKQWGEWTTVYPQGLTSAVRKQTYQYGTSFYGIDKKTAGRSLDGRIWNQYPEVME